MQTALAGECQNVYDAVDARQDNEVFLICSGEASCLTVVHMFQREFESQDWLALKLRDKTCCSENTVCMPNIDVDKH